MGLPRAFFEQVKTRLWPLRPTLVTTVILIVTFTVIAIGLPAYFTSKRAVQDLWKNLASQIAKTTTEVSLRFLNDAKPIAKVLQIMVDNGQIDVTNFDQLLNYTRDFLSVYPNTTWIAFSSVKGDYISTYRLPDSNALFGTIRTIQSYNEINKANTEQKNYMWANEKWTLDSTTASNYDPRTRPFWIDGINKKEGSWTSPFTDLTTKRASFAYTLPQYNTQGELLGLWEVEFRIDYLSQFLSTLKIGSSGQIWIVTADGFIVGNSQSKNSEIESVENASQKSPILQAAWQEITLHGERVSDFTFQGFLGYIESFPSSSDIPWKVLTIVPKADFLGPIEFQAKIALLIGLAICIFFSFFGIAFFGHISEQLKAVAYEMVELSNLNISPREFSSKSTFVKEVNLMNVSTDRLKIGLSSFAKYVPIDLIHNLIQSGQPARLGGRKNEMTVLFSDLARFTELAEQLPPVRLLEILSEYFTAMGEIINKRQGQIDKFIGDAIMAFWGAPAPLKDHARAACLTALEMRSRLASLWESWKVSNKPLLSQRIGINTGNMIVGNIGSPNRMQYTVIGDPVNLGSRLEGLNKFYGTQILVGEETARNAGHEFTFRPLDWVFVKGRLQTTLIYELVDLATSVPAPLAHAINLYEQALYLYRNREFMKAAQKFEEAHDAFGGKDPASSLMAERARQYFIHPPADDWTGVATMQEK